MAQDSEQKSWWVTLPGILTQLVALITAVTGLIVALYQSGFLHHGVSPPSGAADSNANSGNPAVVELSQPTLQNNAAPALPASPASASSGNLANAPAPKGSISIQIGDTIADGVPVAGAGNIESPGSEDQYHFSAAAGQRAYFHKVEFSKGMDPIHWRLTDEAGLELFNTCLGCGDVGVQTFSHSGTYILTVGNEKDPATGSYKLRMTNVAPASRFAVKLPVTISDGLPGAGAGVIEAPGASDVYTFAASPKQRVYFRRIEIGKDMESIHWRLTDEAGMEVFDTCLGCGDPGVQTLTLGGTYTLTVGNEKNAATGAYKLGLTVP